MTNSTKNSFVGQREQDKPLADEDDLLNVYDQTKGHALNIFNRHFEESFRQHIPYKDSKYTGSIEKKEVTKIMDKWINDAFRNLQNNVQGHDFTAVLTESVDEELTRDVRRAKEELENELENRIKQRKLMPSIIAGLYNYSLEATSNAINRIEFVVEEEEEEEVPELPTLKRPYEIVKEEYKEAYKLLDRLDEDLSSKRSRLEGYLDEVKKVENMLREH